MSDSERRRFDGLDGVRGIAILAFLLHNTSAAEATGTLAEKLWTKVVEWGWAGVELGFALTGFLITKSLLEDRDEDRAGRPAPLRTFFARRLLRIVPLYYVLLLVYVLVAPLVEPTLRMPSTESVWYWTFLCNWAIPVQGERTGLGPTWAVAVVMQLSVLWPLVVTRVREATLPAVCLGVVALSFLSRVALTVLGFDHLWTHVGTLARADSFALGALVAVAMRSDAWRPKLARAIVPTFVGSGAVLATVYAIKHGLNGSNPIVAIFGYGAFAFLSAALVALAVEPGRRSGLAHPVLRFFGRYSYGLFLVHSPLKHILMWSMGAFLGDALRNHPIPTDVAVIGGLVIASLGAAVVANVLVERPLLRAIDRRLRSVPRSSR